MKSARSYNAEAADLAAAVTDAGRAFRDGGLVVFPTETVYGVGAWMLSDEGLAAQRRIRTASDHAQQFTVHMASLESAKKFIDVSQRGLWLMVAKLLRAPVTVVVDVPEQAIASAVTAMKLPEAAVPHVYREGTVSLRYPSDAVARRVLASADGMVLAGGIPTAGAPVCDGDEAESAMAEHAAIIINTGRTRYAKPSTVVRVSHDGRQTRVKFIREGVLDQRSIGKLSRVNLLMVCSGNTCRSPMAAGVTRKLLADRLGVTPQELADAGFNVVSAGASAGTGFFATPEAVSVAEKRGIDLSRHRSQPLTRELINEADHIFCMTHNHLRSVLHLAPDAGERVMLLDETDVNDPIGAGIGEYERTISQIEKAVARRIDEFNL